jgi:hypothetical protein
MSPSDPAPGAGLPARQMSTFPLGPRRVRRSGYGAMQLAGPWAVNAPPDRASAIGVLRAAVAAGMDQRTGESMRPTMRLASCPSRRSRSGDKLSMTSCRTCATWPGAADSSFLRPVGSRMALVKRPSAESASRQMIPVRGRWMLVQLEQSNH